MPILLRAVSAAGAILACAACAQPASAPPLADAPPAESASLVPGTIRAVVEPAPKGVRISALDPSGPAAHAGLHAGDVIVRYNGADVLNERQFDRLVLDTRPGTKVRLQVLRGAKALTIEVTVHELLTTVRF